MIGMSAPRARSNARPLPASDGFRKVRRDHASETAEDYVEAIAGIIADRGSCRVADLARLMRVSHVTVVKTVDRLVAAGLVRKAPYGPAVLTPAGARLARAARVRHERVLAFLRSLGVPESVARRDAEGLEHHVSSETIEAMARFARRPGLDCARPTGTAHGQDDHDHRPTDGARRGGRGARVLRRPL
jgi:DtxR family manganese transport transcriptional regulator